MATSLTGRWNRYDTVPAGRSNASVAARTAEPIARRQIKPYLLSTSGESPSRYQIPCILSPRGRRQHRPCPCAESIPFRLPHGQTGAHEPVSGLPERANLVRHWLIWALRAPVSLPEGRRTVLSVRQFGDVAQTRLPFMPTAAFAANRPPRPFPVHQTCKGIIDHGERDVKFVIRSFSDTSIR